MKVSIVSGSHRKNSQSQKVARFCKKVLEGEEGYTQIEMVDLGETPLPFWDDSLNSSPHFKNWNQLKSRLQNTKAFIFVSPEWGGMVPSALKNFFLLESGQFLYHRPALLVSVSASRNGAYPIAELRMSSFKNTHVQYLTEQVIVRNASHVLNELLPVSQEDEFLRGRLKYGIQVLREYAKALEEVHQSGVLRKQDYPYGM